MNKKTKTTKSIENQFILVEQASAVTTITLNRPDKLNALSTKLYEELDRALEELERDASTNVIVFRGAGRAFSAGNDMSERCANMRQWRERLIDVSRRILKIWNHPKVTIASIHGYCLASGCEFAAMCDITIASEDAKFGEPEILHGSMAQVFLPWLIGMKRSKEWILTGDMMDAHTAERIGLVNRVVPRDKLESETQALARKIARVPPEAVEWNKKVINKLYEFSGLQHGRDYMDMVSTMLHMAMFEVEGKEGQKLQETKYQEGMKAFLKARAQRYAEVGGEPYSSSGKSNQKQAARS